jgi:hypothetical protein
MWKWVAGVIVIVVIVAVVMTWQAERCETAREECQAATAARPLPNPMVPIAGRPNGDADQQQSQSQTGRPCAHANGYLCLVLTPTNLPAIYLILVGIGGIVVAIGTLKILERQTHATAISAEATKKSVVLQEMQLRQWVDLENWEGVCDAWELSKPNPTLNVTFDIWNHTPMPLTLKRVVGTIKGETHTSVIDSTITPEHSHPVVFPIGLRGEDVGHYGRNELVIHFNGHITYEDAAKRETQQPIDRTFICGLYKPI